MITRGKFRGRDVYYDGNQWFFDDGTLVPDQAGGPSGPCTRCGLPPTPEGYDACLGNVPGAMNACCGHGEIRMAYVQFWNGTDIRGQEAKDYQESNK